MANHRPKIFYATQVASAPPTIVLFCSNPASISRPYQRYLLNTIRDQEAFPEVPLKLYLRAREEGDARNEIDSEVPAPDVADSPADSAADNA